MMLKEIEKVSGGNNSLKRGKLVYVSIGTCLLQATDGYARKYIFHFFIITNVSSFSVSGTNVKLKVCKEGD